jgi:hypothetical protein
LILFRFRTILLIIVVACAVALGVLPALITNLAEHELSKLRSQGKVRIIRTDGVAGFILGIKASSIQGFAPLRLELGKIKSIPLHFQINSPLVSLSPRILPPGLKINISAEAYGGELTGTLAGLSDNGMLNLIAKGIDLSKHPQMGSLGVISGHLSFEISKHPLGLDWMDAASYKIDLNNLDLELPEIISGLVKGLSSLRRGDLSLSLSIAKGGGFNLKGGKFNSSFGEMELTAEGVIEKSAQLRDVRAQVRFNLVGDDGAKLLPWIPILTNGALSGEQRRFSAEIGSVRCGAPNGVKMSWGGCVRLDWKRPL